MVTRGRPYEFPDPKDRSVNDPHVVVEREAILGLYNQSNQNSASNVSESVRDWFEKEAKQRGWSSTMWPNQNTAVLGVTVNIS